MRLLCKVFEIKGYRVIENGSSAIGREVPKQALSGFVDEITQATSDIAEINRQLKIGNYDQVKTMVIEDLGRIFDTSVRIWLKLYLVQSDLMALNRTPQPQAEQVATLTGEFEGFFEEAATHAMDWRQMQLVQSVLKHWARMISRGLVFAENISGIQKLIAQNQEKFGGAGLDDLRVAIAEFNKPQ